MERNTHLLSEWLLSGDVSVQYQVSRDLLSSPADIQNGIRARIALEGWGKRLLDERDFATGLWGGGIYSPKWVSTHYTLLELKNLGISPETVAYRQGSGLLLNTLWPDPGKNEKSAEDRNRDICVSAMALGISCYAYIKSVKIDEIVDYILFKQFDDGGWNCRWDKGAVRSSLHTTLTVLEAFRDYEQAGYTYRLDEMHSRIPAAQEFILKKRLFRSVRTGEIIDSKMLMLSYPCRWKYDILRCLDYFASIQKEYDNRMDEALVILHSKRRKNNRWPVQHKHAGRVYFDPEPTGGDSRMNTLRALRVIKFYRPDQYLECMEC
jgi:hypothetical protein